MIRVAPERKEMRRGRLLRLFDDVTVEETSVSEEDREGVLGGAGSELAEGEGRKRERTRAAFSGIRMKDPIEYQS